MAYSNINPADFIPADISAEYLLEGAWLDHGTCAGMDPETFNPAPGESTLNAREACAECIVRTECLERALIPEQPLPRIRPTYRTYGWRIQGGYTPKERQQIRRQRHLAELRASNGGTLPGIR